MTSKNQQELEIKKLRIACNTYVGAWRHGSPAVRQQYANTDAIVQHFDNLIANLKEKYAAESTAQAAAEKASKDLVAEMTNVKTDFSQYKLDYINPTRRRNIELRNWQQAAADNLFVNTFYHKMPSQLLLSGVGTGKTMMAAELLTKLIDSNWATSIGCFAPFPFLVVTKATVVEQFKSDLTYRFGIDCENNEVLVTNYEQLRSKFGEQFIKEETVVVNGEPEIKLTWKPYVHPAFIVWDECHSLKNDTSTQHKIAMACNEPNLNGKMYQLFMSATPFTRISDTKCFTISTRHAV